MPVSLYSHQPDISIHSSSSDPSDPDSLDTMETVSMLPSTARSALTKRKEGAVRASAIS